MVADIRQLLGYVFAVNFCLLFIYSPSQSSTYLHKLNTEVAPLYENAEVTHWNESQPWYDYLSKLTTQTDELNLIREEDYCSKVQNYQKHHKYTFDSRGIPVKEDRKVFSTYSPGMFVKRILANYTSLVSQKHYGGMKKDLTPFETLDPSTTLFFHLKPSWHKDFEIGVHFLCKGQKYNHIPGNIYLNFKDITAKNFREYGELYRDKQHCFDPWKIHPFTYDLTDEDQCLEFMEQLEEDQFSPEVKWLLKKSRGAHRGEGVFVVDQQKARETLLEDCPFEEKFLAQQYIGNPLLINKKKFDFRVYMLIASMDPLIVLYKDGFVRISMSEFNPNSSEKSSHLTNLKVGKGEMKSKNLTQEEQEAILQDQSWSFTRFQEYLKETGLVEENWIDNYMRSHLKKVMFHLVRMNMHQLLKHPGVFELFGLDFMLDTNLNLWYLECNLTPAISQTSEEKSKINTKLIEDIVDIEYALLFNSDLDSLVESTNFEWVYDGRKQGTSRYHGLIDEECL